MTNYRKLIRNLRTGNHLKLKIMQPPIELEAIAALLREAGTATIKICPPGTPELPLAKNNHWRLSCRLHDHRHYEISTFNGKLYIRKITQTPTSNELPLLGYTSPTHQQVDLADPEFHTQAYTHMNNWQ